MIDIVNKLIEFDTIYQKIKTICLYTLIPIYNKHQHERH